MSIIDLHKRIYYPGLNWDVCPKNKIDTFTCKPINNALTDQDVVGSTNVATSGLTGVSLSTEMYNITDKREYARGYVAVTYVTRTTRITLATPAASGVIPKLVFEGSTSYINRRQQAANPGTKQTYDWYNSNLFNSENKAQVIRNNADGSGSWTGSQSVSVDYSQSSIPLYPFVRKLIQATDKLNPTAADLTPAEDVLTDWVNDANRGTLLPHNVPYRTEWFVEGAERGSIYQWPRELDTRQRDLGGIIYYFMQQIDLPQRSFQITSYANKIDDYTYDVTWTAPIEYVYYAAARTRTNQWYETDNYAFVDTITQITVQLLAQTLDDTATDLSYSLDHESLTQNVLNNNPIAFEQTSLITRGALWGSELWTTAMAQLILTEYKKGKYIVTCDVPAKWAIESDVHVGTQMHVELLDGSQVRRGTAVSTMVVKNIEKIFKDSRFYYTLKLLEE